jgi:hypothetical protein
MSLVPKSGYWREFLTFDLIRGLTKLPWVGLASDLVERVLALMLSSCLILSKVGVLHFGRNCIDFCIKSYTLTTPWPFLGE